MTTPPPLTIGGKYRVIRRLGQGGMGSVYEALDPSGERVAVKVIQTELANDRTVVGRFAREARAASAIDTPHIAKALDAGTDPETGRPFLVMELLHGEDIEQIEKRLGPLPPELALRIAAQACVALEKAHAARVLHRDIKPANLFLAEQDGRHIVKLLDFGVAKVKPELSRTSADPAGLTRTGSMLGSPLYMSPEQARGYKDIDFRSDLWSLGVVLYKMLSGRAPHDETEELGELIVLICTEPPLPVEEQAPWVTPALSELVHRALRINPAERFQSAAEMLAAITALLPDGTSIEEPMIRPLTDEEKAASESPDASDRPSGPSDRPSGTLRKTPALTTGSGSKTLPLVPLSAQMAETVALPPSAVPPRASAVAGSVPPPASPAAPDAAAPSAGPASDSGVRARPTASGKWAVLWIGGGIVLAMTAAVLAARHFSAGFRAPIVTSATAPLTVVPSPEGKPRSVTVVISPPNAGVLVDDQPATLSEGVLQITGTIGSVHRVRVSAHGTSKTVRVVVAETGAVPPTITIEGSAEQPMPPASTPKIPPPGHKP